MTQDRKPVRKAESTVARGAFTRAARSERRRMLGRRRRAGWTLSLNLTPMIDTVFNLLFFFMIVSRFGILEGLLPAPLPARTGAVVAQAATEVPRTPLRIEFAQGAGPDHACTVVVSPLADAPIAISGLARELSRIRDASPGFDVDTPVYLLAGDDVLWDHVVNAYNAAMTAGYRKIFFSGAR